MTTGDRDHAALCARRVGALDVGTLTPMVRRALRHRTAFPVSWRAAPLAYAAYMPARTLLRVDGVASVDGASVPWSAVVKVYRGPDLPTEARFYRSRLALDLPRGIGAPRLLALERDGDGAVWLWLERVEDAYGGAWPLAQFGVAAHHLGLLSGRYAGDPRFLRRRWLKRAWADSHADPSALPAAREELERHLRHPDVRALFDEVERGRMRRLLADQPRRIAMLAGLPQTLSHHDASTANLFARRVDPTLPADDPAAWETVAIDWEEVGPGPIGAEMATLVFGSIRRGAYPVERVEELERVVLAGYERGLRAADWKGDMRTVHLAYAAAVALRRFLVPATLRLISNPTTRAQTERTTGTSADTLLAQRIPLLRYLLCCAEEARRLDTRL